VIVTASSARINERVAELRAAGFEAKGRPVDLTQETQVSEFVAWAEVVWGRIDFLVNNAGMAMQGSPEPFAEFTKRASKPGIFPSLEISARRQQGSGFG